MARLLPIAVLLTFFWAFTLFLSLSRTMNNDERSVKRKEEDDQVFAHLFSKIDNIEKQLIDGRRQLAQLEDIILRPARSSSWTEPIVVLVFVCNRAMALKNHLDKLIKSGLSYVHSILRYRPSIERFPIVVSQDCDDQPVADTVAQFGQQIGYIKHLSGEKANITVLSGHERYIAYYRISRHYRLALSYVFDQLKYSTVIITEDDLDIAADFFEYFAATRPLLAQDKSLFCVSAWNDNGKADLVDVKADSLLYRSDFFSGLGWMMSSDLWNELKEQWPAGFWDDWIRDPLRRKKRSCIRPELPRTAMTLEGKSGASMYVYFISPKGNNNRGLFFFNHLIRIQLAQSSVNFTRINLDHLHKDQYDTTFLTRVYTARLVTLNDLTKILATATIKFDVRVQYNNLPEYLAIADKLHIMHDLKAGVPRTAYRGIVTCFVNGIRVFIAPERDSWKGYNPTWEAPPEKIL